MKRIARISGILLLTIICFGAGAVTSMLRGWGSPIVTVQLENASQKDIPNLALKHEHGSVELQALKAGDSEIVKFYSPGESSYTISGTFSDGQPFQGGGGYVEAGYSIKEVIDEQGIKTTYSFWTY